MVSHLEKKYPVELITDADYTDDLELLTTIHAQAESLLHSLEQTARSIGLYLNSDKTGHTCFSQDGAISSLNGKSLKLEDQFAYLGSNISLCN